MQENPPTTRIGLDALAQGLALNAWNSYGRYVLENVWQAAVPVFANKITHQQDSAHHLHSVITEESKYLRQSRRLENVNRSKRVKICATQRVAML